MNARLLTIVPTRSRPENVAKVVRAWEETDAFRHADLLFVYDLDDPRCEEYEEALRTLRRSELWSLAITEWMPLVRKLNRAAMMAAQGGRYFALGFAGDDHLPRTYGWAARYLHTLADMPNGTGVVYGDDGYQGARLCTEWAMTTNIVRALGRMIPAPVEHLYCDDSVMKLAKGIGRRRFLPDVRIEHMHPLAKKSPSDAQYERVNSSEQKRRDHDAYVNWLAAPAGYQRDLREVALKLNLDRPV